MRKIFLDTCGILAIVNKRDSLHETAAQMNSTLLLENVNFITTEYIIVEVGNALAKNKPLAVKTIDYLYSSEDVQILKITDIMIKRTLHIYKQYIDKEWGLTDISSFVVMREYKIDEAFTKDSHFEQYGFKILL